MAVSMSISVQGLAALDDRLDQINPKTNSAWVGRAIKKAADLTRKIAAEEMIIRGSRFRGPSGPRGGKGKIRSAGTHPTKLTSRHGGAGIVGSIRVNTAPLPWAAEVGSDKAYAAIHEFGGTVQRTLATSSRSGGSSISLATYPKRAFMAPGLEKASRDFTRLFQKEWAKEMPR